MERVLLFIMERVLFIMERVLLFIMERIYVAESEDYL